MIMITISDLQKHTSLNNSLFLLLQPSLYQLFFQTFDYFLKQTLVLIFHITNLLNHYHLTKSRGYIRWIFGYLPITLSQNLDIRIFESAHQFDIRISEYQIFSISVGYPSNIREYPSNTYYYYYSSFMQYPYII